jgi:hypothetical protein
MKEREEGSDRGRNGSIMEKWKNYTWEKKVGNEYMIDIKERERGHDSFIIINGPSYTC